MEKTFKTYDELIAILESRGIDFSAPKARGQAKRILQHEGYYNLINGYKAPFLQKLEASTKTIIISKNPAPVLAHQSET